MRRKKDAHSVDFSLNLPNHWSSPDGSDGKESACNAGDLGSSCGLGRSSGEGNGNPLQLWSKDPLEKDMATHSGILAWRIPWTEELGGP